MKNWLDTTANIVVILTGLSIGGLYIRDHFSVKLPVASQAPEIRAGDALAQVPGHPWSAHERTLVLVLRSGCIYCVKSTGFYQRLAASQQARGGPVYFLAVLPDDREASQRFMRLHGLAFDTVADTPSTSLKVLGTPTLILVDRKGRAEKVWGGQLAPEKEAEVIQALAPEVPAQS